MLDLQDEITCLEKELDEVDWDDFDEDSDRLKSRDFDIRQPTGEGEPRNRRIILREIKSKLMEYGKHSLPPIFVGLNTDSIQMKCSLKHEL